MDAMLRKVGDDLALVLDRGFWAASGIDGETEVEVVREEAGILVRPKRRVISREEILATARRVMDAHDETLRKLGS